VFAAPWSCVSLPSCDSPTFVCVGCSSLLCVGCSSPRVCVGGSSLCLRRLLLAACLLSPGSARAP